MSILGAMGSPAPHIYIYDVEMTTKKQTDRLIEDRLTFTLGAVEAAKAFA